MAKCPECGGLVDNGVCLRYFCTGASGCDECGGGLDRRDRCINYRCSRFELRPGQEIEVRAHYAPRADDFTTPAEANRWLDDNPTIPLEIVHVEGTDW